MNLINKLYDGQSASLLTHNPRIRIRIKSEIVMVCLRLVLTLVTIPKSNAHRLVVITTLNQPLAVKRSVCTGLYGRKDQGEVVQWIYYGLNSDMIQIYPPPPPHSPSIQ